MIEKDTSRLDVVPTTLSRFSVWVREDQMQDENTWPAGTKRKLYFVIVHLNVMPTFCSGSKISMMTTPPLPTPPGQMLSITPGLPAERVQRLLWAFGMKPPGA